MGIVGVCFFCCFDHFWVETTTKIRNLPFSTMLGDDVYFINAMGSYMRWVQPKGFFATLDTQGTSDDRSSLGC
jgi:hypothetical protein